MKALVIGGSGLVGHHLIQQLLNEPQVEQVIAINRKPLTDFSGPNKYKELIFDFKSWSELRTQLGNLDFNPRDAAFCVLGSTIKKAGSNEAFYHVDHDLVLQFAGWAFQVGIASFLVVSAMGADAQSKFFYNRVKGQMEEDLKKIGFTHLTIARPSLLLGERSEKRFGERLAIRLTPFYSPLLKGPLRKYHPIEAKRVAASLVKVALNPQSKVHQLENELMLSGERLP